MQGIIEAPLPFLVGIPQSRTIIKPDHVLLINLDRPKWRIPSNLPPIPKEYWKEYKSEIKDMKICNVLKVNFIRNITVIQ